MEPELSQLIGLAGIPLIIGMVALTKRTLQLADRFAPIAAVAWGLALNLVIAYATGNPYVPAAVYGVMAGLGAVGLYSGARATTGR